MTFRIPAEVKRMAARGLEANKSIRCNNAIGVRRARQLIAQDEVSIVTIKKMLGYLLRAKVYYKAGDLTKCGTVSYLLWGGIPALNWTKKIIKSQYGN